MGLFAPHKNGGDKAQHLAKTGTGSDNGHACWSALNNTKTFFFFFFVRYRSSFNMAGLPMRSFCKGVPQCLFFVYGTVGIQTHILVIIMQTLYHYSMLTPIVVEHYCMDSLMMNV